MTVLAVYAALPAYAVHDAGFFQLDGNATTDPAPPAGDDWDRVCHEVTGTDCSTTSDTSGATAVSWSTDNLLSTGLPSLNATIFTGGGSKDPQDISNWAWKDGAGGLPDKDNLIHSFAARYSGPPDADHCPAGSATTCDILYFGSDRYDNSGDAQQGFWFFQNQITLGTTSSGGGFTFNGVHKAGDVLVISDFSNGGTTSTITVYRWDPTCLKAGGTSTVDGKPCGDANLARLATSTAANCASAADADGFCGIVNPNTITMPWSFTDKSGTPDNKALNGEFYEGGVNLSTLGLSGECFSSVASETRSSTSTTAVLKDFILGQFAVCHPTLTTQASTNGSVLPGVAVHDTATVEISGTGSRPDPTGTVTFHLCGPSASATACTSGGTSAGTGLLGDENHDGTIDDATPNDGLAKALSDDVNTAANPLAPGFYCFRADWPGDTNYPGALSATNDTTECFQVLDTSSMTTAQDWLPNDTATITSAGGSALSGTVTFNLYDGALTGCDPTGHTKLYGPDSTTFSNQTSPHQVSTSNSGAGAVKITVANNRTVTWVVTFTSSDPGVTSPSGPTCEFTVLTITN